MTAPQIVRMAFHDCVGGCDGCLDLKNPSNRGEWPENIYKFVRGIGCMLLYSILEFNKSASFDNSESKLKVKNRIEALYGYPVR